MKTVRLPDGETVPALGQGTWHMGERGRERKREVEAVRRGIDLGLTLIDTAEMYGDGGAERIVGEAIAGQRDECFLVSKVYPFNASRKGVVRHCEQSLERLGTDRLDLYLLHWRGDASLADAMAGFGDLVEAGKIRHYGVSNLDVADLEDLWQVPGGAGIATNQLLYHLGERGIEVEILPWLAARGVPVMAYSPLGQGRLLREPGLRDFAERHGMSPAQAALARLVAHGDVIAIPKSSDPERLAENRAAAEIELTEAQIAELDTLFPAPTSASPLRML